MGRAERALLHQASTGRAARQKIRGGQGDGAGVEEDPQRQAGGTGGCEAAVHQAPQGSGEPRGGTRGRVNSRALPHTCCIYTAVGQTPSPPWRCMCHRRQHLQSLYLHVV